jgi:hypothetical protein
MTAWTTDELDGIEAADELEIASLRSDGTLRHPTTIWVVRLGDDLYVRSVNGAHLWLVPRHTGAPRGPHPRRPRREERDLRRRRRGRRGPDRRRVPHEVPPLLRRHRWHDHHAGSASRDAQARAALLIRRDGERRGVAERRRTGIEPARELVAPSTVLKTAEPTRNPDASGTRLPGRTLSRPWRTLNSPRADSPGPCRHTWKG